MTTILKMMAATTFPPAECDGLRFEPAPRTHYIFTFRHWPRARGTVLVCGVNGERPADSEFVFHTCGGVYSRLTRSPEDWNHGSILDMFHLLASLHLLDENVSAA